MCLRRSSEAIESRSGINAGEEHPECLSRGHGLALAGGTLAVQIGDHRRADRWRHVGEPIGEWDRSAERGSSSTIPR